jgi:hypothetical protein
MTTVSDNTNTTFQIVLPEKLTDIRTSKESPTGKLRAIMKAMNADPTTWLDQSEDVFMQAAMQSGWLTSTGVDIPADATDADIAVLMHASAGLHKTDGWARGDTAYWIRQNKFGGSIPNDELEKLAKMFGCSGKRILNSATTSAAFPKTSRNSGVPFSIYEVASKVGDQASRDYLVEQAAIEGWSVRAMTEKVSEWIATNSTVNDDGEVVTPGEVVLNPDGTATVVQGNVTVSTTGGAQVNVDACIKDIAQRMIDDGMTGVSAEIAVNVLKFYANAGMIKFPVKAWLLDDEAKKEFGKEGKPKAAKVAKVAKPKIDVDDDLNSFTV